MELFSKGYSDLLQLKFHLSEQWLQDVESKEKLCFGVSNSIISNLKLKIQTDGHVQNRKY